MSGTRRHRTHRAGNNDAFPGGASQQPVLLIATPAFGGMVTHHYANALAETAVALVERGARVILPARHASSLIQINRNLLVAEMLASPIATHLLWIDADIGWRAEDVLRLFAHDVDLICGLYPKKQPDLEFPAYPDPPARIYRHGELSRMPLRYAGLGFMLVRRSVYESMATHYPKSRLLPMPGVDPAGGWRWAFNFHPTVSMANGQPIGEDLGFCERWRAMGGEIWCDPHIRLTHYGLHGWDGDVAESLMIEPEHAA